MSIREHVFQFEDAGTVRRIPYKKWCRVREGDERKEKYANQIIHIAYAYIVVANGKPEYCSRIDGAHYYFDLLQDLYEDDGGVIRLEHRKKKWRKNTAGNFIHNKYSLWLI